MEGFVGNHEKGDYWLLKLDSAGGKTWSKCFGGSGSDIARSVQQIADGSYLVAGSSSSPDGQVTGHTAVGSVAQSDYWIANVDSEGNLIWGKTYGGSANDDAYSLEKTSDKGFIVAGTSSSTDAGFVNKDSADYWLLKFSGCGNVPLPDASDQKFCSSMKPIVSDLVVTGTNLKWYTSASGGTALAPATPVSTGIYYVNQTTSHGCESDRIAVSVTVNPTPGFPNAPFIQVFSRHKSPKVSDLVAYGSNLKWYNVYKGGIPLSPSTPLVTGFYFVSQTSAHSCESGRRLVIVIVSSLKHYSNRPSENEAKQEEKTVTNATVYPNPSSNGKVTVSLNTSNILRSCDHSNSGFE